jgi:uncharacterized protein (TIGR02466 family)
MKIEVTPVFSYAFAETILSDINSKDVINTLKMEKYSSTHYSSNNNEDVDIFISKNLNIIKKFPLLNRCVNKALRTYISDILQYTDVKYKITRSWGTMTPPGGKSQRHKHCNSWISGIYYPKTINDGEGGDIKFYNKRDNFFQFDDSYPVNLFNAMEHIYTPTENMLLLFDSSLEHKITKNLSNQDRYSIAFNVFPVGKIGMGDSQLTFSVD